MHDIFSHKAYGPENTGIYWETVPWPNSNISTTRPSYILLRKCLTTRACQTTVHALVTSRLDCGNAVLFGVNVRLIQKQMLQKSAARLITRQRRRDHQQIAPTLTARFTGCRSDGESAISFFVDLPRVTRSCTRVHCSHYLAVHTRTSASFRRQQPTNCSTPRYGTYCRRGFSVTAPRLWNDLPV